MTLSQALATPVDEIMESSALAPRINGFHLEPRCRICRNDVLRKKVNDLLATGASYAMIVRALSADNAELDKCDRVTIDSVRTHCHEAFSSPERRQSNVPGDPRTPGKGEPRRLHRGRGHRDHPHCILRDRHGEKL